MNNDESLPSDSLAHTRECASQHFAPWMVEEHWFRSAIEAVKNGTMKAAEPQSQQPAAVPAYAIHNGVAIIPIAGPMMKAASKFGGTSTVMTRRAIRKAIADDAVHSILLHIDSPGGTVAGTADLASDVAAANAIKPVHAHIEDLGASAAYWVASQARRVTANTTGRVGSIGTLLVLDDTSGMYAARGIKVHVISTGKFKGAGTEGAPITDEQVEMFREGVNDLNEHFILGVAMGRGMSAEKVRAIADGRVHIAEKAKQLGLIDAVESLDHVVSGMASGGHIEAQTKEETMTTATDPTETTAETVSNEPITNEQHQSQRSDEVAVQATPEITEMANDPQGSTAQTPTSGAGPDNSGNQIAKLNQQAIESYIQRGRELGLAEGHKAAMDRMAAILSACPGRDDIAVKAFMAGQGPDTVRLVYDAAQAATNEARKQAADKDVEIARLQAVVAAGGHPGVAFAPQQAKADEYVGMTPEQQAKAEWDSDYRVRNNSMTEKQWMLYRTNQLRGNVRALSRA